jgi:hypothetical protein
LTAPLPQKILDDDPTLTGEKREAGQDHKLCEFAPGHVMILRPVNRKILPPFRLRFGRASIGRDRNLFAIG